MVGKDLLSMTDLTAADVTALLQKAVELKVRRRSALADGRILALLFEKPSLRTRVSFEVAMRELGGEVLYLSPAEVGIGERESASDVARVLGRYVDIIAARTFSHRTVEVLAEDSGLPVINALSDREHPCQALADLLTIHEKRGSLAGLTLAYIGDGNNVANSLLLGASLVGMNFRIASPVGFTISGDVLQIARDYAAANGSQIVCSQQPEEVVAGADVVYSDVWTSMGQEAEAQRRQRAFTGYQVNAELMSLAGDDAIFMHDLPAHRGEEVTDDVIDGPQSVVFDQAENRMHAQKAVLAEILSG
jgi:ornithine carbamoyltransferase